MISRTLRLSALVAITISIFASEGRCALPPEVKKELTALGKELKEVQGMLKKKEVDQAKELIKKTEDRIKELAIAEDEKDRSYATFKTNLEKAKNLIPVSFEQEVAPILNANCLQCHGEAQASANLRLDTYNMIAKGGRSGVPVVPRVPQRSGLVLRMVAENEQQRMPRGRAKLADAEIMTIARWIEQGAAFDGKDQDAPIGDSMVVKKPPVTVVKADGTETVSFSKDIAPWMVNICMGCHSGNNPRGNFGFTTFEQLLQGGPTGTTIVPGKPDESYIVDLVLRQEPLKMPAGTGSA
jgi:mono/diheme cytochrome c family protein